MVIVFMVQIIIKVSDAGNIETFFLCQLVTFEHKFKCSLENKLYNAGL